MNDNIFLSRRGATLVEVLIAITILSIGALAFISSFTYVSKSIRVSRGRSLATALGQEKIEQLKNYSYYKLQLSTSIVTYNQFTPPIRCDAANYPPEELKVGGVTYTRCAAVNLGKVTDHEVTETTVNYPDTGIKYLTVYVMWQNPGGAWKYVDADTLYENPDVDPLNTTVFGQVTDGTDPLPGALVRIIENSDWDDYVGSDGSYSISAQDGTYSIKVSSSGFYSTVITGLELDSGQSLTTSFHLLAIGSGSVAGNAWINTDIVLSQVVVATQTSNGGGGSISVEYFELFNPTTFTITIGDNGGGREYDFEYHGEFDDPVDDVIISDDAQWEFVNKQVPSESYFLVANSSFFYLGATTNPRWVRADAWYGEADDYLPHTKGGSLRILKDSDGSVVDQLGWCDNDGDTIRSPCDAEYYEEQPIPDSPEGPAAAAEASPFCDTYVIDVEGIGLGNQAIRKSSPGLASDTFGKAYDAGDNLADWVFPWGCDLGAMSSWTGIDYAPRTVADGAQTVIAGKPAIGAYVAASDLLGPTTTAFMVEYNDGLFEMEYAHYELDGVSTGTWEVIIGSGDYVQIIENVTIVQNETIGLPSAATNPTWPVANVTSVFLGTSTTEGYVTGIVEDGDGNPIEDIEVTASGNTKTTAANGHYFIATHTGTVIITANPNNENGAYIESVEAVVVESARISTRSFSLPEGGTLMGFATTDGHTILPNLLVTATRDGLQYGNATSDSAGNFYIKNLASGTYVVEPVLDPMESASPATIDATVSSTGTVDIGTFTISGAMGVLVGSVTYNGSLLASGALIVVRDSALSDTPPSIVASSAAALSNVLYSAASEPDGTYSLDVRGSTTTTYFVSAYVPIVGTDSVSITTKTYSGITITAAETTRRDIEVP